MKRLHSLFCGIILLFVCFHGNSQVSFLKHRKTIALEEWSFSKGNLNKAQQPDFCDESWKKVKVPHTYSMDAIEDIGYYRGNAWYRTKVNLPVSMSNERVFIRFEGVGHEAVVFVNGKRTGKHSGGYSAFCYELTDLVKFGEENSIAVKVSNYPDFKLIPVNDKLFNAYGGIYRPVHIFSTSRCNISPLYYASSGLFVELKELEKDLAEIEVRTHISTREIKKGARLIHSVRNAANKEVLKQESPIELNSFNQIITRKLELKKPILWDGKKNPHLYKLISVVDCDGFKDTVCQEFGIRTYEVSADKGFLLNNEPYPLYGVCRHQEWKQFGPALQDHHHIADMDLIDEIGAKSLRLSHYQHSDIVYKEADKRGLLVWAEIPFVNDYSGREGDNAKQQLAELILQNYNHPSIFVWGLWNEVRARKSPDEPCVILANELNDLAHQLDQTRLTTSASDRGIESNMGNTSDIQAWNKYFGWYYGEYEDLAEWLDQSHKKYPKVRIGISEYGIGANILHQDPEKLEKPSGDYFPEMEQSKYHEIAWGIIKDRPFLWCSFIWNMFDFSVSRWNRGGTPSLNHKGLITFDRKVKKDAFYFYKANWSDEPVLYIAERRNNIRKKPGTTVKVYTNMKKVTLYVNDKEVSTQKLESDIHLINFENIVLENGKNKIRVVSKGKKANMEDTVTWYVQAD